MSRHLQAESVPNFNSSSPLRLLIVEDVPEDAELIILALEDAEVHFSYQIVENVARLQALFAAQTWDAVLSDFRLTGTSAYQVLETLRQANLEIPLILVTGTLGEEAAVECIKAGVTDYVLKDRLFRLPMVLQRSLQEFALRRQQQAALLQIQQQAMRESITNRIVQAMRGTLVFEEMLQTTADQLHEALAVSRCLIFLPNEQQILTCRYVSQLTAERETVLDVPCDLFEHFAVPLHRGELVQVEKIDESQAPVVRMVAQLYGVRAFLMAPLVYQNYYCGALCLQQRDRNRAWTPDEMTLVKAIADHCAIAIYQSQLLQQTQQQAHREQLLNQIGRALNSSLDPDYILQEIVKVTGECFRVDRVFIFAVEAEQVRVSHEWRVSSDVVSVLDYRAHVSDWLGLLDSQTNQYFMEPVHLPHHRMIALNEKQQECIQKTQRQSLLSVPIFIRDQFFGGIELHTTSHQRVFSPEEISLLQRIADQSAIALYNARSYERLEELVQERTQELEAEKLLSESANRAKTDFLANMSHELRTPLTSILGFSSVLLKQVFGSLTEKQKQYLSGIYTSGEHLLDLINDLLDLSKIEAGREELILEANDVQEICQACLESVHEQATTKGLSLACAIAPEVQTCIADRRRLKQILMNLLSNAVKFTEAGSVSLNVCQIQHHLQFAVQDTGIGIAPADLDQLFQPFHQVHSGLDRKYQGTGLGLALARKLAQLHGGTITVTSELGNGSCFSLLLPVPLETSMESA